MHFASRNTQFIYLVCGFFSSFVRFENDIFYHCNCELKKTHTSDWTLTRGFYNLQLVLCIRKWNDCSSNGLNSYWDFLERLQAVVRNAHWPKLFRDFFSLNHSSAGIENKVRFVSRRDGNECWSFLLPDYQFFIFLLSALSVFAIHSAELECGMYMDLDS